MRALPVVFVAAIFAGCAARTGEVVQLSGPAPAPAAQTMTCLNREFQSMGYRVIDNDAQAVTAVHVNETPWYLRIIGYKDTADQITARVEGGQLRVSAISSDPTEPGAGGPAAAGGAASNAAARDARRLISACGSRT